MRVGRLYRVLVIVCAAGPMLLWAMPAGAAFPGVNGKIAFEDNSGGDYEIYVRAADGGSPVNLTNNPAADYSPSWSPGGARIAFTTYRDGNAEVYVMNADGSEPENLTKDPSRDSGPNWSPDGASIVFSSNRNGNYDIYVMDSDGTDVRQLTDDPAADYEPAFSPDGDSIIFTSERDGNAEIYRIPAGGGSAVNLTNRPQTDDEMADWSPDGTRITFNSGSTSREAGTFKIWVMNADGSGQTNLSGDRGGEFDPSWSPDGKLILFDSSDLYVMAPDGSDLKNLTNTAGADEQTSDWQPLTPAAGDADCSGGVNAVDALMDLRDVAGLSASPCVPLAGNVKCDDGLTSVDALLILRYVAALPVSLPNGCPGIGS